MKMNRILAISLMCLLWFFSSSAQVLSQEAVLKIDSLVLSENHHQVIVNSTVRIDKDIDNADLRYIYLVVEDSIDFPENSLSGILSHIDGINSDLFSFDHSEVRDIIPSVEGIEGSVPSTIRAMEDYGYSYLMDLPTSIEKQNNVYILAVLYDAIIDKFVKADMCQIPQVVIEEPEDPSITVLQPGTLASMFSADDFKYLKTLKLKGQINGTDIATLRQMTGLMVSEEDTEVKGAVSFLDLSEVQIVPGGSFYIGSFYDVDELQTCEEADVLPDYAFCSDFDHKSTLKTLILPDALTKIGAFAFAFNDIKSIENTKSLEVIGEAAFFYAGLRSIQLNAGLTRIEADAFWSAIDLELSVIPESVNYIGSNAFGSTEKITDIVLPGNVVLEGNPFMSCRNLRSITFSGKSSRYVIEDGLLYTSDYSTLLMALSIPTESVVLDRRCKRVEYGAFNDSQATDVIALGLEELGWMDDIGSIKNLYLGSRIKSIDYLGGDKVLNLYLLCQNPPKFTYRSSMAIKTIYALSSSISDYKNDANWRRILNYLPIEDTPWYDSLDEKVFGDSNRDGKVSVADLSYIANIIMNRGESVSKGDMNGDGKADAEDLTFILSLILNE